MDFINNTFDIPKGYIVMISGVPGSGKTTISYNLLKQFADFRIIEETDLIREVLLGYNDFLKETNPSISEMIDNIKITDHNILLSLNEAKQQCRIMKSSIEKIVERQKRKGIPSIINGVHIIPSALNGLCNNNKIIYINLYVNNKESIYNRIYNRDPNSYMLNNIEFIYNSGKNLFYDTMKLEEKDSHFLFNNIDVTNLTINETIDKIVCVMRKNILSNNY